MASMLSSSAAAACQIDIFNHLSGIALDHSVLVKSYAYDKRTGLFSRRGSNRPIGSFDSDGYVKIAIHKKFYAAHRLAWFYVHGVWPTFVIDHINRKRYCNWLSNLRDVHQATNRENRTNWGRTGDPKEGLYSWVGKKHYDLALANCDAKGTHRQKSLCEA